MHKPSPLRPLAVLACALLLLSACGGGGGGGDDFVDPPPSTRFGASSTLANICTPEGEKRFVRAYLDEVYLWYDEIQDVNPADYATLRDYFNALLVRTPDPNGLPKDRFSAIIPAAQAQAIADQDFSAVPDHRAAQPLADHTDAVPVAKVVTSPAGRRTGYLQFNDHDTGAQDDLITAVRQLRDAGIQDLVLDLRFNSGGFLYVAQTAASLVTGPENSGRVFEDLRYNDKRDARTAASTLLFTSTVEFPEGQYAAGTTLPQLGLPRVFILTSGSTCSSSESIINGLRGIDVQVVQVGATTCGKPYGFTRKENCGMALFPIEFQGFNAKGFGDYTLGFAPTCPVADNPTVRAGSNADPLLNAALYYIDRGACPPASPQSLLRSGTPGGAAAQPDRPPWAGRLLGPLR